MEFKPFHDYNKMVRRGAAEPLVCEACYTELTVRVGKDDEPYLQCFGCDSTYRPGQRVYEELERVTKDYFKRNK